MVLAVLLAVVSSVTGLASSNALPTAQITGIVWATTTVGDTVYATGRFSKARPTGVLPGGAGEVARGNLVAFNITTGKLTSFSHVLNAEGKAIVASKDGATLFVGGLFTSVNGQPRSRLAAFSTKTGALLPTHKTGPSGAVYALASAGNGKLYVGGGFSRVGAIPRKNLAAYTAAGNLDPFNGFANGQVSALVVTPDNSKLVVGGSFSSLSGSPAAGLGAVSTISGAADPAWAKTRASFSIKADDPVVSKRGITSLTTDGVKIYGTAFNYIDAKIQGSWEGTFAVSATNGNLVWGNNCHGDTYDAFVSQGVLYSVGHAHDCKAVGVWPETQPQTWHRVTASTTSVDGVNVCGTAPYYCYAGMPRSSILTSFTPVLNTGSYSGAGQAAWTVTGNSQYVVLGGEFTKVNGKPQQGLTRMVIG